VVDESYERRALRVTVSGSFRRAIAQVAAAVEDFQRRGATVLSPTDPRPLEQFGDFVYVASDLHRTIRLLQERHFEAIVRSDLLWLCAPDGRLGDSAAAEVHHANLHGIPVFTDTVPDSLYWRQVVIPVRGTGDAVTIASTSRDQGPITQRPSVLLEPQAVADALHADVELISRRLVSNSGLLLDDPELRAALGRLRAVR
jgi:hypothetical protein